MVTRVSDQNSKNKVQGQKWVNVLCILYIHIGLCIKRVIGRVGKILGFFKKTRGYWVFLGFIGFFSKKRVFLGFFGFFKFYCFIKKNFTFFLSDLNLRQKGRYSSFVTRRKKIKFLL